MILKRCENGHYYDGEIYTECPNCKGTGGAQQMRMPDRYAADYADEDSVTVALPRSRTQGQGRQTGAGIPDTDDPVTVALPRSPQAAPGVARKPGLKPVVGWLVCIRGNDFGSSFTVKLGKNYIGRSADMDIILHGDGSIAMENHAAIYYVPKQRRFAVEPGTSGKLFYLNRDTVMRPVWIKQHDILTFGTVSLMFFPCCGEHFNWEELIRKRKEKQQGR